MNLDDVLNSIQTKVALTDLSNNDINIFVSEFVKKFGLSEIGALTRHLMTVRRRAHEAEAEASSVPGGVQKTRMNEADWADYELRLATEIILFKLLKGDDYTRKTLLEAIGHYNGRLKSMSSAAMKKALRETFNDINTTRYKFDE